MIVMLIVADSLKAETPGYAGGGAKTPFLDRLAGEGVRFDDAFASGAWTIPSLMSMLTGALGHRVGICRWRHPYPAGRPNLLTAFAAAGFETMCFHPYPQWGFLTIPGRGVVGDSQDPAAVARALRGGGDRFVLIHHWWTHLPYLQRSLPMDKWQTVCDFALQSIKKHPDVFAAKLEDSHRKAAERFSEDVLPRYLDAAAAGGGRVLTVVTSDHGETWGRSLPPGRRVENVYDLHGRWITDETIRVPLVFHGDASHGRIPAGLALGGTARGVDLGPTIAELAGAPWPGPAPLDAAGLIDRPGDQTDTIGASLASSVMTGAAAARREVCAVSSHNTHVPRTFPANGREMWRTMATRADDAWFIWDGVDGQGEVKPVGGGVPDERDAAAIFARLEARRQEAVDSGPPVPDEHVERLRKEGAPTEERLRALGYLD